MKKFSDKIEIENDSDGWWGYCKTGWHNSEECSHTFHENTKKELLKKLTGYLMPCDCPDCKAANS